MDKLAIVILNYNSTHQTQKCLNSVRTNLQRIKKDIIVVDNNSSDDPTAQIKIWAKRHHIPFKLIDSDKLHEQDVSIGHDKISNQLFLIKNRSNSGYSGGNKLGIILADKLGDALSLILNPDTIISPSSNIKRAMEILLSEKNASILSPLILLPNGRCQDFLPPEPITTKEIILNIFFNKNIPVTLSQIGTDYFTIPKPHGCCMLIKNEDFLKLHFWDENLFMYGEESVIYYKLMDHKKLALFYPGLIIIHDHHQNKETLKTFTQYIKFLKSKEYILKKYYGWNKLLTKVWLINRLTLKAGTLIVRSLFK